MNAQSCPVAARRKSLPTRVGGAILTGLGFSGLAALAISFLGLIVVPLIWAVTAIAAATPTGAAVISVALKIWLGACLWYIVIAVIGSIYGRICDWHSRAYIRKDAQ